MQPEAPATSATYNLIANVCHEGPAQSGTYKVQIVDKAGTPVPTNDEPSESQREDLQEWQWYEVQDLLVEPTIPQMLFLAESYVQV